MAKLLRVSKGPLLTLSEDEVRKLGLKEKNEYQFSKNADGEWILQPAPNPLDARILNILSKKEMKDRVEGVFETYLNREEHARFRELLQAKKILPYKGGEQYKKSVYRLPQEIEAEHVREKGIPKRVEKIPAKNPPQKSGDETAEDPFSAFEQKGFAVIKGDELARQFGEFHRDAIQAREILGLKDFDGNYWAVAKALYETTAPKIVAFLAGQNQAGLKEVAEHCQNDKALVKGVCALLREEGQLIEKRNEVYQLVK